VKIAIIGAGHNGLTAAAWLAKAGHDVQVFEQCPAPGGLCAPQAFGIPGVHHDTSCVRPGILDHLNVQVALRNAPPLPELPLPWLSRVRAFVAELLNTPPPALRASAPRELLQLGRQGLALRRLGKGDMHELLRVAPMAAADWLGESLGKGAEAARLAFCAVQHTFMGPWSAGSAANLLFYLCTRGQEVDGGPAALISALLRAASSHGAAVSVGTRVTRIVVRGGVACGVVLESGAEVAADRVLACCDPKVALLDLLPGGLLPMAVAAQVHNLRARGTTAKVHLKCSAPQDRPAAEWALAPDIDGLERAFDAVKYGRMSANLQLDVQNRGEAMSVLVSYVPPTYTDRSALLAAVLARLGVHAVESQVLLPGELGCLHRVEHALDQLLFMRPIPACARYRTPVPGYYLGGSGNHPGGGVTCAPGALAAQAVLAG
jgi:phytoene dehydrogenase-like protein